MSIYPKLVSDNFNVPLQAQGKGFIIRPLTPTYASLDYDAVRKSKSVLGEIFSDSWPEGINNEQDNLAYIEEDYQDFKDRVGFSYIILDPDESYCMGCLYLFPSLYEGFDVVVYY